MNEISVPTSKGSFDIPANFVRLFEYRYGYGGFGRLLESLVSDERPSCAAIGRDFGVTAAAVYEWIGRLRRYGVPIQRRKTVKDIASMDRAELMSTWGEVFNRKYGPDALDRLVRMLDKNCMTMADIGKEFGVTRERVRQWRVRLARFKPGWSLASHHRRKMCTWQRATAKPFPGKLASIAEAIRERGMTPKLYIYRSGLYLKVSGRAIVINGMRCHPARSRRAWDFNKSRTQYWHFTARYRSPELTHLFICGDPIEAIYVVPDAIIKPFGESIFIPTGDRTARNISKNRFDWEQYREAWHLLERPKREELAAIVA